ncbi:MAG: nucleotide exchange factor GrpE, partial [Flavobacteriales bacterium]|nr:nucleotide exchange factor GrpE [Flavobacteriales bacterium]
FSTANKELMTVLLPILDDFERGLKEIEKSSDDALMQGMQLIYNKFKNTLNQKGLKEMEVKQGDTFDAEIHEAITQIPAPSKKLKGKIIDTVEKGYKLGETIIRYPKVVLGN